MKPIGEASLVLEMKSQSKLPILPSVDPLKTHQIVVPMQFHPFNDADPLANLGFIREEATTVVVMIGDEADNSRRMQQGQSDPETYIDLFSEFEQKIKFAAIGPNWDGDSCFGNSGGATTWAVERVQTLALSSVDL